MSQYKRAVNKLLSKIKGGDTDKIDDLFRLTFNHIKVIAITNLHNKEDYEDVVVESFIRIIKYIGSFNPLKDGYNWICKIVENVAKDFNRENKNLKLGYSSSYNVSYFDDEVFKLLIGDVVVKVLHGCSSQDKKYFYYHFYLGLSYGEIAKRANCAKSYVHKRVDSVINKIKKVLKTNC